MTTEQKPFPGKHTNKEQRMAGFIIGLILILISVGNYNSFSETVNLVYHFLFWWYAVTSVITFFTIFQAKDARVANRMAALFPRAIPIRAKTCFGLAMFLFIVSRPLIFIGLSFLSESIAITEPWNQKFVTAAVLISLGAIMGSYSTLPSFAQALLQKQK